MATEPAQSQSELPSRPSQRTAPIRVLVAKPGLDGHDRGAKVMEVVYTGLFQSPEMIADTALQEDVDVIGLSILSGAHLAHFPRIMEALRERELDDVLVIAGGTIPGEDVDEIQRMGIAAVFGPGTSLRDAVEFIREHAPVRDDVA
jgi:methylmalonyl-CoA mutase, C-terminal domain